LLFDVARAVDRARVEDALVSAAPREEGDLVDGNEPNRPIGLALEQLHERARKVREAIDEHPGEEIEPVRIAVVEQIPDDLDAGVLRGADRAERAREVVQAGRSLDEVPADALARGGDPDVFEPEVILLREAIVLRLRDHVEAAAGVE